MVSSNTNNSSQNQSINKLCEKSRQICRYVFNTTNLQTIGIAIYISWVIMFNSQWGLMKYTISNQNNSNCLCNHDNSDNLDNLVSLPDRYVNIAMVKNIEFLNIKMNCVFFTNQSKHENLNKKIKMISAKAEYLLLGFIDIMDIKLRLDEHVIKVSKHYKQIKLTKKDKESYQSLADILNNTLTKIDAYTTQLKEMCDKKYLKSPPIVVKVVDTVTNDNTNKIPKQDIKIIQAKLNRLDTLFDNLDSTSPNSQHIQHIQYPDVELGLNEDDELVEIVEL